MKIAILSFYSGEVSRGVETYVHELANHLVQHNQVTVYQNGPQRSMAYYDSVSIGIPIDWQQLNGGKPFINYQSLLIKRFTEVSLKKINPDTDVVLTTNGQWQSVLVRKWTRKRRIVHIIVGQSGPGLDDRINIVTTPDSFVALTKHQKKWAEKAIPFISKRIDKIPNGIDIKKFSNAKKIPLELPHPIILNVAALVDWKGQQLAIEAVAKMSKGSLLLVGKGSEQEKLQKIGNELLPGRFAIKEFPYEEMPSVYASTDIFTFPTSPWESFGIVMLEAMASGLPVVATDDPIRREIVGNAGLFVNPHNAEEYANALEKALETKWKDKPRKQAEKFAWEKITKLYETLFMELTSKKSRIT